MASSISASVPASSRASAAASSPSFSETLATMQPHESELDTNSSSSASMLQQLRSEVSWRTAAVQQHTADRTSAAQNTRSDTSRSDIDQHSETGQASVNSNGDKLRHTVNDSDQQRKTVRSSAGVVQKRNTQAKPEPTGDVVEISAEAVGEGVGAEEGVEATAAVGEEPANQVAAGKNGGSVASGPVAGGSVAGGPVTGGDASGGVLVDAGASGVGDSKHLLMPKQPGPVEAEPEDVAPTPAGSGKPKLPKGVATPLNVQAHSDPLPGGAGGAVSLADGGVAAMTVQPAVTSATNQAATATATAPLAKSSSGLNNAKGKSPGADLAFALKIDGKAPLSSTAADHKALSGTAAAPVTDNPATASAFSDGLKAAMGDTGESGGQKAGGRGLPAGSSETAVPTAAVQTFSPTNVDSAASTVKPDPTKALEPLDDKAAGSAGLKSVQVQITGANDERVDLRLVEKAGALTISVRGGDATLTRALQQNLPALAGKLNEQQVRAEWWTPEAGKVEAARKTEETSDGSNSNSGSQDQGRQSGGQSGQQGGRGARQQPDWVDDLVDPRKSNENGAQYAWHL